MSDDAIVLQQLRDVLERAASTMEIIESLEHRVSTVIEGGRQQLSHLVDDLQLPHMRSEMRAIRQELQTLVRRLK
jgi:hypothetical protein